MRLEDMKDTFPKMPEDIKNMIEKEVAMQIKSRQEESMDTENARQSGTPEDKENAKVIKYRKKKKDAARRMLVASMVVALALATTVCAGVVYQMHNEKVGKYGVKTKIEGQQTAETENRKVENHGAETDYVELTASYLPDGMVQTEEGKYSFEDNYMEGGISMVVYRLPQNEKVDDLLSTDVAESEELEVEGRPAVYLEKVSSAAKNLYVIYAEHGYMLEMFAFPDVTKEEMIHIAEGLTVVPTEKTEGDCVMQLCDWNQTEEAEEKGEPVDSDSDREFSFDKTKMENTHAIGESINMEHAGIDNMPGLTATVASVELSDNSSILADGMLDADAMKAFDADGNLLPMKLEYIKSGDGINTTDEVVKTETLPQKIVYATVKYENNGTETLHDIMYNGGIAFLEEKGSQMQFADYFLLSDEEKASTGCDYREPEQVGFSQEVYLSDVTGGERNNNYINELKPGESVTVHFAFKIPEEKLGEMYLTLSNTGGVYSYDETSLAVGYVDIRQK